MVRIALTQDGTEHAYTLRMDGSHVPGSLRDRRVSSNSFVNITQNGGRSWRMNSCFGNALDKCRPWLVLGSSYAERRISERVMIPT
jgi:hypothetical protein